MTDHEPIPAWAVELIKKIERLNERLPNHVDWTERNIKDHEVRLRALEIFMWKILGLAGVVSLIVGGVVSWIVKVAG